MTMNLSNEVIAAMFRFPEKEPKEVQNSFMNILVTGANRGLGLEFIKQFLKTATPPKNLIATTRGNESELDELKAKYSFLHILKIDLTEYQSHKRFVEEVKNIVGEDGLDMLINNAGMYKRDDLFHFSTSTLTKMIENNAVAPFCLTLKLLPLIKMAAKKRRTLILNITADMGSIACTTGGCYGYRASKSVMNQLFKTLSVDVKKRNIIVLLIYPGWLATDMGGELAPNDPAISVLRIRRSIERSTLEETGKFFDWAGTPYEW